MELSLAGRTLLITGASSGIGAHFAKTAAAAGAKVVLGARRTDLLDAIVAEIQATGGEAIAVAMDVADKASTLAAFDVAEAAFGPVVTREQVQSDQEVSPGRGQRGAARRSAKENAEGGDKR